MIEEESSSITNTVGTSMRSKTETSSESSEEEDDENISINLSEESYEFEK